MNKTYKLQLVSPITSNKIYESSSINKGVKKCYTEFKNSGLFNKFNTFAVIDINTNKIYKYGKQHSAPGDKQRRTFNKQYGGLPLLDKQNMAQPSIVEQTQPSIVEKTHSAAKEQTQSAAKEQTQSAAKEQTVPAIDLQNEIEDKFQPTAEEQTHIQEPTTIEQQILDLKTRIEAIEEKINKEAAELSGGLKIEDNATLERLRNNKVENNNENNCLIM